MLDIRELAPCELLAVGRRALELCAGRLGEIAKASDPEDRPLRELLRKTALDQEIQAHAVESLENQHPEDSRLPSRPEEAVDLIHSQLGSLVKRFGELPLARDIALFFAESLEEECARFFRALSGHARESSAVRLFSDLARHENDTLHQLRDAALEF